MEYGIPLRSVPLAPETTHSLALSSKPKSCSDAQNALEDGKNIFEILENEQVYARKYHPAYVSRESTLKKQSLVSGSLGHTFQGCSNGCDVHPKEQPSRNRQEAQSPKHGGSWAAVALAVVWQVAGDGFLKIVRKKKRMVKWLTIVFDL